MLSKQMQVGGIQCLTLHTHSIVDRWLLLLAQDRHPKLLTDIETVDMTLLVTRSSYEHKEESEDLPVTKRLLRKNRKNTPQGEVAMPRGRGFQDRALGNWSWVWVNNLIDNYAAKIKAPLYLFP